MIDIQRTVFLFCLKEEMLRKPKFSMFYIAPSKNQNHFWKLV